MRKKEESESGDGQHTLADNSVSGSDVVEIKRPEKSGRESRTFTALPNKLQRICFIAQACISNYTLFGQPLLGAFDVINRVNDTWEWAQDQEKSYKNPTRPCDSFVGCSRPLSVLLLTKKSSRVCIHGTGRFLYMSIDRRSCESVIFATKTRKSSSTG